MMATGGFSRFTRVNACGRACAIRISQAGNAQRYCEHRPSSSSTISSFGFDIPRSCHASADAGSATPGRTEGRISRIVVPACGLLITSRSPPASRNSSRAW